MSTTHTAFGKFLNYYRALKREGALDSVPVLLSEGDSWFSTPLYYNLVDWLEVGSPAGAFLRMESSGDLATRMFTGSSLLRIADRLEAIEFDALLISAGGNDFVSDFLAATFQGTSAMSVDAAFDRVRKTGRFKDVRQSYEALIRAAIGARPQIQILAHSYDYPIRMGKPAKLTVEQIGLAALFKRSVGDWIERHVKAALPAEDDQRAFARRLIDHFEAAVLHPLHQAYPANFHYVDLRGRLPDAADWNDEMHPTGAALRALALPYREALRDLLAPAKRAALG